jgi:PAS domain S-box-containing protein
MFKHMAKTTQIKGSSGKRRKPMGKDLKGSQANHDAEAYATSGETPEELVGGIPSDKLQQEEVLHQQPVFATEVLNTVGALVAVLDRQGRIISFNRACEEATGYSLAEVQGKYLWDFLLVSDEVEPVKAVFAQLQTGQFPNTHEYYWVAKDGAHRRIHWTISCLIDSFGAVEYVVATGIEVTERKLAQKALAASEERYRELVETTNSVILRWDRQGTIRFINEQGASLLGYDPHELIGRHVSTLVPEVESTGRDLSSLIQSILDHPKQYIYNPNENIRKDGTRIWIAWTNKAVTNEEGTVREILAIGNNITALKEAEHSLRESERRFHHLFEDDLTGNFLCTVEGRILLCNAAFADIFGFSSAEAAVGRSLLELYIDLGERNSILETIRAQGKLAYYETWRKRCDGNPIHVVENLVGHFNDQGDLYEIQGYIFDDTKRKRAEEALQQQAQLLHLSYDAILVWRKDGGIEHWNRGAEKLYGFTESEALGRVTHKLLKTIHPVPWPEIEAAMRKHGQWEGELRHFAKDGHEVTVSARHQLMLGTDGIERILETNRDITERKQMEEEIRKSRDELEIRVQERTAELEKYRLHLEDLVKQRTTELARSNKDLEQFAYVASHDLQEPLRAVSGFVSLLQQSLENSRDEKTREYMDFTVDGVARMQSLINGLLEYSRLDTRAKPAENTDSGESLNEALLDLQSSIKESGAKITGDKLPRVNIDPVQLKQLFQNLISNAIKFRSHNPPKIHISADRENNAWRFAVKDNSIGIERQYYERIFMIFQRLHTRKKYPGTGIGLPLCKKIVERHGGNIWVESAPGHGSTFYFTIPDKEGSK